MYVFHCDLLPDGVSLAIVPHGPGGGGTHGYSRALLVDCNLQGLCGRLDPDSYQKGHHTDDHIMPASTSG